MKSAPEIKPLDRERGRVDWTRLAAILVCFGIAAVTLWILGRYIIAILIPFVAAWVLSCLIRPAANWLSRHSHIPPKVCAAFLMTVTLATVGWLVVQAGHRVLLELGHLLEGLTAEGSGLSEAIDRAMERIQTWIEGIPFLSQMRDTEELSGMWTQVEEMATRMIREAALELSGRLSSAAVSFVTGLPAILLSMLAFLMSCYYFCMDGAHMEQGIVSVCPASWQKKWPDLKARGGRVARRYVRAYALLWLVTFVEMFIGFSILRVPYSFLLATVIAVVDLLPVFGTGTVLVPWALVSLLLGQYPLGSGLLILYGVSLIVRQVAEPRLVGASLGLHPLASFAAMFVGYRLFGIVGLLLGPAVALSVTGLLKLVKSDALLTE